MDYRLDEVDRRIIYRVMENGRHTSAPDIAEEVSVTPPTIRNRIQRLEKYGIITGYTANVDFEQADDRLTNLFICTAPVAERRTLATKVQHIPGVINVRELMTGEGNLHVVAVAADMEDMTRIAKAISELKLEIKDQEMLQREFDQPYAPFGPEEQRSGSTLTDFISLTGEAEVFELGVGEEAALAGRTLEEANESGILDDRLLIIAIERDGAVLTPKGHTTIEPDDLVTVFSQEGMTEDLLTLFENKAVEH